MLSILSQLKEESGEIYRDILRFFMLEELDRCWKDHLRSMDYLREGIGLRGYGQRDPKLEYKREGFNMFQQMLYRIHEELSAPSPVSVSSRERNLPIPGLGGADPDSDAPASPAPEAAEAPGTPAPGRASADGTGSETSAAFRHKESPAAAAPVGPSSVRGDSHTISQEHPRVGRNDPCPCGSGKKYKKCCGAGK